MKSIFFLLILILLIFNVACTNYEDYVTIEEYNNLKGRLDDILDNYSNLQQEYNQLKVDNYDLENSLNSTEKDLEKYQKLLNNLNDLLANVYYVYGKNTYIDHYTEVWGTGFSIEYSGKYYLITAGHIVDGEWGIHENLGFRDIDNNWIYPELLAYIVTVTMPDYAIFYSDKVENGFQVAINETEPDYRLGINKII